jgi:hypothetical protein
MSHDSTLRHFSSKDVRMADWGDAGHQTRRNAIGEYEVATVTARRRDRAPRTSAERWPTTGRSGPSGT